MTSQNPDSEGYYANQDKLTFDEADVLVTRYIREYTGVRCYTKSRHVADAYEVEPIRHNLIRITDAMGRHLEPVDNSGTSTALYKMTDDK